MAMPENYVRQIGESAIDVIERQDWLETIGNRLQGAVSAAFSAGGDVGRRVRDFLHGTWLGHPLHPVLTDVPIGAWTTAVLLDALDTLSEREYGPGADAAIGL